MPQEPLEEFLFIYIDIMIAHWISLYYAIMIAYVMSQLDDNQEKNETAAPERKHLRRIIVILDHIIEYNRLTELANLVKYRSKLMSYYGLDLKTGNWNTKQFPVTQSDTQMEEIKSDIKTYNKAVRDFNMYEEFLARKYCMVVD
jgi:hypothetical protein